MGVVWWTKLSPPPSSAARPRFKVAMLLCPCLRLSPSQLFRACSTAFLAFSLSRSTFFRSACMRHRSFLSFLVHLLFLTLCLPQLRVLLPLLPFFCHSFFSCCFSCHNCDVIFKSHQNRFRVVNEGLSFLCLSSWGSLNLRQWKQVAACCGFYHFFFTVCALRRRLLAAKLCIYEILL